MGFWHTCRMSRSAPQSSSGSPSITNSEESPVSPAAIPCNEGKDELQRPLSGPREIGGREGPEPTRFGDWEKGGRCIDF